MENIGMILCLLWIVASIFSLGALCSALLEDTKKKFRWDFRTSNFISVGIWIVVALILTKGNLLAKTVFQETIRNIFFLGFFVALCIFNVKKTNKKYGILITVLDFISIPTFILVGIFFILRFVISNDRKGKAQEIENIPDDNEQENEDVSNNNEQETEQENEDISNDNENIPDDEQENEDISDDNEDIPDDEQENEDISDDEEDK